MQACSTPPTPGWVEWAFDILQLTFLEPWLKDSLLIFSQHQWEENVWMLNSESSDCFNHHLPVITSPETWLQVPKRPKTQNRLQRRSHHFSEHRLVTSNKAANIPWRKNNLWYLWFKLLLLQLFGNKLAVASVKRSLASQRNVQSVFVVSKWCTGCGLWLEKEALIKHF